MKKYRNKPFVDADGIRWDSQAEARRWSELKLLERAGEISGLERQVTVPLVVNGVKVCALRPDYAYFDKGVRVYEDMKGFVTRDWALRWKLAKAVFPSIEWRVSGRTTKKRSPSLRTRRALPEPLIAQAKEP